MQKGIKFRIYPEQRTEKLHPPDAGMLPADLQPGTCHAQGKL